MLATVPPVDGVFVLSDGTLAPLCQLFNKLDDLDDGEAPRSRDVSGRMLRADLPIQIEAHAVPDASTRLANTAPQPHPVPILVLADSNAIGNNIDILRDSQRTSLATC